MTDDTNTTTEEPSREACPVCHDLAAVSVPTSSCHSVESVRFDRVCVHTHTVPVEVYFHDFDELNNDSMKEN